MFSISGYTPTYRSDALLGILTSNQDIASFDNSGASIFPRRSLFSHEDKETDPVLGALHFEVATYLVMCDHFVRTRIKKL